MTSPQCSSNLEESETIELKTGLSELEDAIIDICALLNHRGGAVYFGVRPNGEIAGLTITDTTFRKVNQKIRARIKPEISLSLTSESYHGKSFLIVTVPEGTNKPYFADGQPYVRSGTESIRMPVDELKPSSDRRMNITGIICPVQERPSQILIPNLFPDFFRFYRREEEQRLTLQFPLKMHWSDYSLSLREDLPIPQFYCLVKPLSVLFNKVRSEQDDLRDVI